MKRFLFAIVGVLMISSASAQNRCVNPVKSDDVWQYKLKRGDQICLSGVDATATLQSLKVYAPGDAPLMVTARLKIRSSRGSSRTVTVRYQNIDLLPVKGSFRIGNSKFRLAGAEAQGRRFVKAVFEADEPESELRYCIQVLACGQLPDGTVKIFPTPCDAEAAGATLIHDDRCSDATVQGK